MFHIPGAGMNVWVKCVQFIIVEGGEVYSKFWVISTSNNWTRVQYNILKSDESVQL